MDCYGKHDSGAQCSFCEHKTSCREIKRFDRAMHRSNRRYAMLKLCVEEACARGLNKQAPAEAPNFISF